MGEAAENLEGLMRRAHHTGMRLAKVRGEARGEAVKTILALESRLREALAGGTLRGLLSLVHKDRRPLVGANVRSQSANRGIDDWLPKDGRHSLILTEKGELAIAWLTRDDWETRPVRADELVAQDLELFVQVVYKVLGRHLARTERTMAGYEATSLLAKKLAEAVGPL
jgi:hypothetical protein